MNQTMQSPIQASSEGSLLPLNSTSLMLSNKSEDNATATNDTNPYYGLHMRYRPDGKALGMETVFLAVIAALEHASRYTQHDRVRPFQEIITVEPGCIIEFLDSLRPEQTMPQPFLYRSVIQAAKRIPYRMLQDERFNEAFFSMLVSGTEVGRGLIMDSA